MGQALENIAAKNVGFPSIYRMNGDIEMKNNQPTCERLKVATVLSSYRRMLIVSNAQVLSARRPDLRDIITRQASGLTENKQSKKAFIKKKLRRNLQHWKPENREICFFKEQSTVLAQVPKYFQIIFDALLYNRMKRAKLL